MDVIGICKENEGSSDKFLLVTKRWPSILIISFFVCFTLTFGKPVDAISLQNSCCTPRKMKLPWQQGYSGENNLLRYLFGLAKFCFGCICFQQILFTTNSFLRRLHSCMRLTFITGMAKLTSAMYRYSPGCHSSTVAALLTSFFFFFDFNIARRTIGECQTVFLSV